MPHCLHLPRRDQLHSEPFISNLHPAAKSMNNERDCHTPFFLLGQRRVCPKAQKVSGSAIRNHSRGKFTGRATYGARRRRMPCVVVPQRAHSDTNRENRASLRAKFFLEIGAAHPTILRKLSLIPKFMIPEFSKNCQPNMY